MKNHNFVYNYGFLSDWIKSNPHLRKYGIMEKMGMTYYKTIQNWFDGETMMPLTQMMKFCNLFNVPITAFFYDECADEESVFSQLHTDAMIEPAGGWKESERKAGIKTGDPRTENHEDTHLPAYCKGGDRAVMVDEGESQYHAEREEMTSQERMKYLDIIKGMSERMMELSRENSRLKDEIMKMKRANG